VASQQQQQQHRVLTKGKRCVAPMFGIGASVVDFAAEAWLLSMLRECDAEPFCVCVVFAVMSLTAKTWLLSMLRVCV
jgi:hypothetical protein